MEEDDSKARALPGDDDKKSPEPSPAAKGQQEATEDTEQPSDWQEWIRLLAGC